jgi:hypothetical protein
VTIITMWKCFVNDLNRSVVFSRYSGFLHQNNWPQFYHRYIAGNQINLANNGFYYSRRLSWARSWQGVLDTTLCDKVCVTGQWFSPGTPVSYTNKTDCHDITEILLKVVLNTITFTFIMILFPTEKLKLPKNNYY